MHLEGTVLTRVLIPLAAGIVLAAVTVGDSTAVAQTLMINAAGTLAGPFREIATAFENANSGVTVESRFGGSVMMAKRITELHQPADILAVADFSVIPKYLFAETGGKGFAGWYVGFARNAITFVYTPKSSGAQDLTAANWYEVLARPGVEIGRSNPDTDPSGYQTLQMLRLADTYYHQPALSENVLKNAPRSNIRDTETDLISALQLGQIDYLAIYRSDALQHHLQSLDLPAAINLSDPALAKEYAAAVVETKNGALAGKPIVYAATIPNDAPHPALAAKFLVFLLGPEGQAVFARDGFGTMNPPLVVNPDSAPAEIRALAKPWPAS
jgi:molybdate/tungstate transport system substrate-binding protein